MHVEIGNKRIIIVGGRNQSTHICYMLTTTRWLRRKIWHRTIHRKNKLVDANVRVPTKEVEAIIAFAKLFFKSSELPNHILNL